MNVGSFQIPQTGHATPPSNIVRLYLSSNPDPGSLYPEGSLLELVGDGISSQIATKGYVDSALGEIESVLHQVNYGPDPEA